MKYYKNNVGSIGYYQKGFLICPTYKSTESMDNLTEAIESEIRKYKEEKKRISENRKERERIIKERALKVKELFGFDPTHIGLRHRGFWIVEEDDPDSEYEKKGYLGIKARDGASNEPDCSVGKYHNYVGAEEDSFDRTYRYYYFKPLIKIKRR